MIGEIRDTETARIAVRASITGHIVLSTIHTNSSLNTIERLLDMDVERYLLASALTGIISQKLARKLCPHCKTKKKTNDYEKELFRKVLHKDIDEIYTTEGCDQCRNGYKGRIAIQEVLLVNQEIKDAISSNLRKDKLRELVYGSSDVITLLQDGLEKVVEGLTTFEEVLKLIELENDDKKAGKFNLKDALKFTNMSQHNNTNEKEPENIIQNQAPVKEEIKPIDKEVEIKPKVQEEIKPTIEPIKTTIEETHTPEPIKEETQEKKTTSYLDEFENLKKELNAKKENNFDWLKDDKLFTDEHLNDPETTSTKLDSNDDDDDLMNMDF